MGEDLMAPANNLLRKEEVAELLGTSERSIERKRELLNPVDAGVARNGRMVPAYPVEALPVEAQKAWAERQRTKVVEMAPANSGQLDLALMAPVGPNLSVKDREEADRRFSAIEPLLHPERYPLLLAQSKGARIAWLAEQHKTKPRTLYNWLQAFKREGIPGLVSKDRSDKGTARVFNQAAKEFILAHAMPLKGVRGVYSVREIHRAYEEERAWRDAHAGQAMAEFEASKYARYLDEDGRLRNTALLPEACYETFRSWFNRIPELVRTLARDGVEAFHNSQELISYRDIGAIQPLDFVVMDHRVLDLFCLVRSRDGWKLARPWLTAAIDYRTRKWLGWVIVETPSSDSIAAVLKKAFIQHGIPKAVYWDNGKDFRCEWLEGKHGRSGETGRVGELDTTWRGVLDSLGVRVHHAIVKRARAKIIEPNFGRVSKFDETLPEFCGHKPTGRPEAFAKMLDWHEQWLRGTRPAPAFRTIEQVAAMYDDVLEQLNERELDGEGMAKVTPTGRGWMCPNEAWEILVRKVERRTASAELLHMLFAKRKEITVQHSEVRVTFHGRAYHYRLMDDATRGLAGLNGRVVEFAYDPLDLETGAVYYQSRFIGLASCAELRRMGEDAFVEDEKARRALLRDAKALIQQVHAAIPSADPDTRLARRKAIQPARENVARVTVPAELPAAVVEAEAAARAERQFKFDQAPAEIESAKPVVEGEDEFRFFS
jgi:transposase InsO family protein